MKLGRNILIVTTLSVVIAGMSIAIGDIDVSIFAFPLNLLLIALWLITIMSLWRKRSDSSIAKQMLSPQATWLALALMVIIGIVIGTETKPRTTELWVIVAILYVLSHLTLVTLRGWRNRNGIRWRFILLHAGLWLALMAGFWGASDRHVLRMALNEGEKSNIAFNMAGGAESIDYEIRLNRLTIESNAQGQLSKIEALADVDTTTTTLSVNHPYQKGLSTKIYIVSQGIDSKDGAKYAVLEIIYEPWQWLMCLGIVMMMLGAAMLYIKGPKRTKIDEGAKS